MQRRILIGYRSGEGSCVRTEAAVWGQMLRQRRLGRTAQRVEEQTCRSLVDFHGLSTPEHGRHVCIHLASGDPIYFIFFILGAVKEVTINNEKIFRFFCSNCATLMLFIIIMVICLYCQCHTTQAAESNFALFTIVVKIRRLERIEKLISRAN